MIRSVTLLFWVLWNGFIQPKVTYSLATATNNNMDPASSIRAISLDVTGTLVATREPVIQSYHEAAVWAKLPDPPSQDELKKGFKIAFQERCLESPCFGGADKISGRDWWRTTVRRVLEHAGRPNYSEEEFNRYFRRVCK